MFCKQKNQFSRRRIPNLHKYKKITLNGTPRSENREPNDVSLYKKLKAGVVAHVEAFFVANLYFKESNEGLCECVSAWVQVN